MSKNPKIGVKAFKQESKNWCKGTHETEPLTETQSNKISQRTTTSPFQMHINLLSTAFLHFFLCKVYHRKSSHRKLEWGP